MPKCLQQAGQDLISLDTELPQNNQFPCRKNKKKEGLGVYTPSVFLALSSCFSGREAASSAHMNYLFKVFHLLLYSLLPPLLWSFFDLCPGCGLTTLCSSAATLLLCVLVSSAPINGHSCLPASAVKHWHAELYWNRHVWGCAGKHIREPAQNKNKIMTGRQGQVLKNGLVA